MEKKTILIMAITLICTQLLMTSQDYNGNNLSSGKIILNQKSSNEYIQSITKKTIRFDGLIDQTFGNVGTNYISNFIIPEGLDDQCNALAVQSDGKIIAAGTSQIEINGTTYSYFSAARFLPSGELDVSFGNNGTMYIDFIIAQGSEQNDSCTCVGIQPNGTIILGGRSQNSEFTTVFSAVQLLPNGQLDTNFGGHNGQISGTIYVPTKIAGGCFSDNCNSLTLTSNGSIILGGNSNGRFALAKILQNGQFDSSFGPTLNSPIGTCYVPISISGATFKADSCTCIIMQSDEKILMGGYTGNDGVVRFAAARFNTNGTPDSSFGNNTQNPGTIFINESISQSPTTVNDRCNGIAMLSNGNIILGGFSSYGDIPVYYGCAACLLPNGQLNPLFGPLNNSPLGTICIKPTLAGGNNDIVSTVALQSDQKILLGGSTQQLGNDNLTYFALVQLLQNGQLNPNFGGNYGQLPGTFFINHTIIPSGSNYGDTCSAMTLKQNKKILLAGYAKDSTPKTHFALAQVINPMTLATYQKSYTQEGIGIYS